MDNLSKKTAFITGGLHRLGGGIAKFLAINGYDLVLQTRSPHIDDKNPFIAELKQYGANIEIINLILTG